MRTLPLRLSAEEARHVRRGVVLVLWGALALVGWWWSPWSPDAIDRPSTLIAWGFPHLALRAYEDLGRGFAPADTRAEALWRGAHLAAGDLEDPQKAIELLRELVVRYPQSARLAVAHEQLATLYDLRKRDSLRAAESWQSAAEAAPDAPEAPARWLAAGQSFARAHEPARAEFALRRAAMGPTAAPEAWLTLGQVLLPSAPISAYDAFESALKSGAEGTTASMSRLGLVTALERQDNASRALAMVEAQIERGDRDSSLLLRQRRLLSRSTP